jgi:hypothetical protein
MTVYICTTCGGEFTANNDKEAGEAQRLHRLEDREIHLNQITYPPKLKA